MILDNFSSPRNSMGDRFRSRRFRYCDPPATRRDSNCINRQGHEQPERALVTVGLRRRKGRYRYAGREKS